MHSYKLYYFDARGLAETTRQIFALAGQRFDDERYSIEEWPTLKKEMPFGQMPVLEVDGKKLPQSWAIARFVARQFGFAGENDFDAAWVDAFGDQMKDYFHECRPLHGAQLWHMQSEEQKLCKEIAEPARDEFFSLVEKQLKGNKSGFLVGNSVTWIDLALVEHVHLLLSVMPDFLDNYSLVLAHHKMIQALPKLKEWIAKRPQVTPICRGCIHPATAQVMHHPLLAQYMEQKGMEDPMREPPGRCQAPTSHFTPPTEGHTM